MVSAIEHLKKTVDESKNQVLDRKVYYDDTVSTCYFCEHTIPVNKYVDIPIASIDLVHRLVGESGSTWREHLELLRGGETGKAWSNSIFEYFDSEIKDKAFNQVGSRGALSFLINGGSVESVNGVHRLIAAVCWRAANNKNDLKQVKIEYKSELKPAFKSILETSIENNWLVMAEQYPVDNKDCLAIKRANKRWDIYKNTEAGMSKRVYKGDLNAGNWMVLPVGIIKNLVSNRFESI